jgi:hypothetical protein
MIVFLSCEKLATLDHNLDCNFSLPHLSVPSSLGGEVIALVLSWSKTLFQMILGLFGTFVTDATLLLVLLETAFADL